MPIKQLQVFSVEGTGHFPIDMLRYDQCWPMESDDAVMIKRTFRPGHRGPVALALVGLDKPEEGRWQSFGWQVSLHEAQSV